jgi:hypothetical protein
MLEDLELRYKVLSNAEMLQACGAIEGTIDYAKSLIIKEKKQIMNAAKSCNYIGGATDIEAEDYYNQTYNQNKFIDILAEKVAMSYLNNNNK